MEEESGTLNFRLFSELALGIAGIVGYTACGGIT